EGRFRKTGQDIPGAFRDIPQIFQGLNPVFDPPVNVAGLIGLVDPVFEALTDVGEPVTELRQVFGAACAEAHDAAHQRVHHVRCVLHSVGQAVEHRVEVSHVRRVTEGGEDVVPRLAHSRGHFAQATLERGHSTENEAGEVAAGV